MLYDGSGCRLNTDEPAACRRYCVLDLASRGDQVSSRLQDRSLGLRVHSLRATCKSIETIWAGFRGGNGDICVSALPIDDPAVLVKAYGHFSLRVSATRDGIRQAKLQFSATRYNRLNRLERGIDGTTPGCAHLLFLPVIRNDNLRIRGSRRSLSARLVKFVGRMI